MRRLSILLILVVAASIGVPQLPVLQGVVGVVEAQAQQKKRKTLFDILFKRRDRKQRPSNRSVSRRNLQELPGVTTTRRASSGSSGGSRRVSSPPPKPKVVVVKNENAPSLLVVGDFMASGLASGLERFYSENPDIVIVDRASASSGIVRDDVVDWPETIPTQIAEINPVAVVFLGGMNDRQAMRLQTGSVSKLSEEWLAEYNTRVERIVSSVRDAGKPLIWVGIPPVKSGAMNTDYLVFNEIYRTKVETSGAAYVDVWDGFTNAEGKYVSAGPDINGQIVRLRGSKGISMLNAGKEKLAFFADKVLKRLGIVGDGAGAEFASLGTINLGNAQPQVPEYDPVGTGKTIVISLGSPVSDGGNELEGGEDFLKDEARESSVSYALVEKGTNIKPRDGRIDSVWGLPAEIVEEEKKEKVAEDDDTKDNDELSSITPKPLPRVTNIQRPANASSN